MVAPYQIIVGALVFSAFFSGLEIAFLAADKLEMQLTGENQSLSGKILNNFLKYPDHFISTTLIGNTIALVLYCTYMAKVLEPCLYTCLPVAINNNATLLILQTWLSTLGLLVIAELIPKAFFYWDLIAYSFSLRYRKQPSPLQLPNSSLCMSVLRQKY
jgi:putative hemolysin